MMKKIISTTLLLAAGAALANAATLVGAFTSFSSSQSVSEDGKLGISSQSTGVIYNDDGTASFAGTNSVMFVQSNENKQSTPGMGLSSAGGFTITMTISDLKRLDSSVNSIFTIHTGMVSNWGVYAADVSTLGGVWDRDKYTAAGTSSSCDLAKKFILTVVFGTIETEKGTRIYVDGEKIYSSDALCSTSDSYLKQINVGALSSGSNGVSMTLHNLYVHSGAMTADEVRSFYDSIPEPSAFGLLAGLGALALVASRRRRSRK